MRTKGFIFIALGFAAATLAGTPGYLPSVGPIGLQFVALSKPAAVPLPVLPPAPEPTADAPTPETEKPVEPPAPEPSANTTPAPVVPVIVLQAQSGSLTNTPTEPLIGPMVETNNAVTPQMFLRFFSPNKNGPSQEAIIAVPPGFNPARPPTSSSTVNYTQPKP